MINLSIFQRIQTAFYKRVVDSPRVATLRIYTVNDVEGSFENFLGSYPPIVTGKQIGRAHV